MDCYSVHIAKECIQWAHGAHKNLILLYIPATMTAWLQPLDIRFNGDFKRIMRVKAATWLADYVASQLQMNPGNPDGIKPDTTLTFLKGFF